MSQIARICAQSFTIAAPRGSFTLWARTADGRALPVEVTRKKVKNMNLRVRRDGSVHLSIPMRCSTAAAQEFLDRKAEWIAAHAARSETSDGGAGSGNGPVDAIPLWGALVPLEHVPGFEGEGTPGDGEALQARLDALYRQEVTRALPAVVARAEKASGLHAARWQVRTMTSRWGSCTPATGAIRINGALAAYPPECLEYVVCHELTHLVEPSHDARFHVLLAELCPGEARARALLKQSAHAVAAEAMEKGARDAEA